MAKIYVASFITDGDYDAMTTSSEMVGWSMADFANGFISCAGLDRAKVEAKARELFIYEYASTDDMNVDEVQARVIFDGEEVYMAHAVTGERQLCGAIVIREMEAV